MDEHTKTFADQVVEKSKAEKGLEREASIGQGKPAALVDRFDKATASWYDKEAAHRGLVGQVVPEIGSLWRHHSGDLYRIIDVLNLGSRRLDKFPVTIAYRGENGERWSRPFHAWHKSFTRVQV